MIIDQLLNTKLEAEKAEHEAAVAAKREEVARNKEMLLDKFREWAGPAWPELAPHVGSITWVNSEDIPTGEVSLHLKAQALQLRPAKISYRIRSGREWTACFDDYGSTQHHFDNFVDFLKVARELFPHWKQQRVEVLSRTYRNSDDYSKEQVVIAELHFLDPETETRLRAEKEENERRREKWQREREEEQQAREAAKGRYRAAYAVYWEKFQATKADNESYMEALQRSLNGTFEVVTLTYGIVANDDDGEQYVGTETIDTLGQDEQGYWLCIGHRGGITRRKYTHVVATEATKTVEVGDNALCRYLHAGYTDKHGGHWAIYMRPDEDVDIIRQMINRNLVAVEMPDKSGLAFGDDCAVHREFEDSQPAESQMVF